MAEECSLSFTARHPLLASILLFPHTDNTDQSQPCQFWNNGEGMERPIFLLERPFCFISDFNPPRPSKIQIKGSLCKKKVAFYLYLNIWFTIGAAATALPAFRGCSCSFKCTTILDHRLTLTEISFEILSRKWKWGWDFRFKCCTKGRKEGKDAKLSFEASDSMHLRDQRCK